MSFLANSYTVIKSTIQYYSVLLSTVIVKFSVNLYFKKQRKTLHTEAGSFRATEIPIQALISAISYYDIPVPL